MHRLALLTGLALGGLVMSDTISNAAETAAGWPGVFPEMTNYQRTFTAPVIAKDKSSYRQTARYDWMGGRFEMLEVTVARDPAFKEKHTPEALKKEKNPPKEVEVGKKKAWLWSMPAEPGKLDQVTGRLVVVLDADKALIIERKGDGPELTEMAKHFDLTRVEKALADPPQAK